MLMHSVAVMATAAARMMAIGRRSSIYEIRYNMSWRKKESLGPHLSKTRRGAPRIIVREEPLTHGVKPHIGGLGFTSIIATHTLHHERCHSSQGVFQKTLVECTTMTRSIQQNVKRL